MALIHDLIAILSEDQIKRIKSIELPVREHQVLEFVLSKRTNKLFPSSQALKTLNLTQSHLEKICSVLMKKIIQTLAGDEAYAQFKFIRARTGRPARLVRYQMRASAKHIKDKAQLITFYSECCEAVTRMDTTEMDEREIAHYTSKLLSLMDPHIHPEKYIKIKCDELYAVIGQAVLSLGLNDEGTRKKLTSKIIRLNKEARDLDHPVGRYQALRIASMFFMSLDDHPQAMPYIEENILVTTRYEDQFNARDWMEARLIQAECLSYMNKFREAYDIFCLLIRHSTQRTAPIRVSSQARFFKVAVTLGEYSMAKEILDTHLAVVFDFDRPDQRIMAHLQFICYYLHVGDLPNAGKHVETARREINRQRQQEYNIQLLFFENAYLYLTGDQSEAKIQVEKNLKFLRSKNINRSNSGYPLLFSSILYIYDDHYGIKPFNKKRQSEFDFCFTESYSHFGGVLRKMKEMCSTKGGARNNPASSSRRVANISYRQN